MGTELNLLKELSTITITCGELASVTEILRQEISNPSFQQDFDDLMLDMEGNYEVVLENLLPLLQFHNQQDFTDHFDAISISYSERYLREVSRPRILVENTFHKYLQFRKRKEVQTKYPILRAAFSRLHDYIDKWIDNDIWLAMTIDIVFKYTNNWLQEIVEMKKKDEEMGYRLYQSMQGNFLSQLTLIEANLNNMKKPQLSAVSNSQ